MKKIFLLVTFFVSILMFVSCNNDDDFLEIQDEVKLAYLNYCEVSKSLEDIEIANYFGKYNDCFIVLLKDKTKSEIDIIEYDNIDDVLFTYPICNYEMIVYKENDIYNLKMAYSTKMISKSDLTYLSEKVEDYFKEDLKNLDLSEEIKNKIKIAYCQPFIDKGLEVDPTKEQLHYYLGQYGDCYASILYYDAPMTAEFPHTICIGDYTFHFVDEVVHIWHSDKYYSLTEAFENNLLTQEDWVKLHLKSEQLFEYLKNKE